MNKQKMTEEIRIPVSKPTPLSIAGTYHIVYPPWWMEAETKSGDTISCLKCQTENIIDSDLMFGNPVLFFVCVKCGTLYGETTDGSWAESEPHQDWLKGRRYGKNCEWIPPT